MSAPPDTASPVLAVRWEMRAKEACEALFRGPFHKREWIVTTL
ncbi:MAG: hypothetical protein WBL72_11805 [Thermoguttaceae bacterium]